MAAFTAVPIMKDSAFIFLLYVGIVFVVLIILIFFGVTIFGTAILNFDHNRIYYHVQVLGAKIGERSLDVESVILVKHSIGRGNETIQVVSERGLIAINRMIELVKSKGINIADLSILGEVANLNNESINIPVASLTLADRFYIEDMILRSMAESD